MKTDLKNKITNVCGIILAAVGIVVTIKEAGINVPEVVMNIATTLGVIAGAVVAYFTGRNADGTSKQNPTKV
jgi:glycopeptide antibiotics resistance protein